MATTENQELYVIHWKARRTGATGHGTASFPKDEAFDIAAKLNLSESGQWREHWIEPVGAAPAQTTEGD